MKAKFKKGIPVLPSSDIKRDVAWYKKYTGFEMKGGDEMYAVLRRENIDIHLQWHADTEEDPLLGGSVVRFWIQDVISLFEEFVENGALSKDKLRLNTAWGTNEFGLYDLNKNALFFFEDIKN
ncbi:glyoxalase/bleomycin resistance/extradiol dioxygenase family protein [uncultured Arcticibacterium sp.]|uniref:glyoxalase/bleomycin resistance/extradiol dioxygenase family protein n=1 Tax=uncultured Arcticibacterium sp. TaxID=2173042 RepID=UPI0030F50C78